MSLKNCKKGTSEYNETIRNILYCIKKPMSKPVTNFLPEEVVERRNQQVKELMEYRKSESAQNILRAMTDEKEYDVDGKTHTGRVATSPYTGADFPANKKYKTDSASGKKAREMYEKYKDIAETAKEVEVEGLPFDENLYNLGKGKAEFFEAKQSLVEEEKKVAALKAKLGLGKKETEKEATQDKPGQIEQAKEEWERAMNACKMPNMGTAINYYGQANEEDKAYLRKILRRGEKTLSGYDETGKLVFRSHGMLQPRGLQKFKAEPYSTEAGDQNNIEAEWQDWFAADRNAPAGSYELKKEVLKASGMKKNITAGDDSEWKKIFNLFARCMNNAGSQEIQGRQVARQMLGISGYIWTNQKVSSADARYCRMSPENCHRFIYYFFIDIFSMSVIGLERVHTDS